jgi:hypothetical protein
MGELGTQEARFVTAVKLWDGRIVVPRGIRYGQHLEKRLEP